MKLEKEYILSKGFIECEKYNNYTTYRLPICDVCYYLYYLDWRKNYSIAIEYTDSPIKADENVKYSFGIIETENELDAFFKIMSYREF